MRKLAILRFMLANLQNIRDRHRLVFHVSLRIYAPAVYYEFRSSDGGCGAVVVDLLANVGVVGVVSVDVAVGVFFYVLFAVVAPVAEEQVFHFRTESTDSAF